MVKERTAPHIFDLPVRKMREGWYSDQYFNLTKELLEETGHNPVVTMQAFQRKHGVLGGIDEAIAILKLCSGISRNCVHCAGSGLSYSGGSMGVPPCIQCGGSGKEWHNGFDGLEVKALYEGDEIEPWEPVLEITGPYHLFAHLETVILGVMARRSVVMNNVREAIQAANGKDLLFFPARHDHWSVQTGDGIAAHVAGVAGVSTDAGASWWGGKGIGTIPHALIAAYGGSTVDAAKAFADRYHKEMNITVLVDFDNDSVFTALAVAAELGDRLWGVRLDTSGNLVDRSLVHHRDYGSFAPTGVVPELVGLVRDSLDRQGHEHVKIVVSGGFKAEKIREFERLGVPVDAYGVGSSLIRGSNDYTADIVQLHAQCDNCGGPGRAVDPESEGVPSPCRKCSGKGLLTKPVGKVGRWYRDSSRLEQVT